MVQLKRVPPPSKGRGLPVKVRVLVTGAMIWLGFWMYTHVLFHTVSQKHQSIQAASLRKNEAAIGGGVPNKEEFLRQAENVHDQMAQVNKAAKQHDLGKGNVPEVMAVKMLPSERRKQKQEEEARKAQEAAQAAAQAVAATDNIPEEEAQKLCGNSHQRLECVQGVTSTNNMETARKLVKMMQQADDGQDGPGGVSMHDAKVACALAKEKQMCIHDVMGTGDLDSAEMYDKFSAEEVAQNKHKVKMSDREIKMACKILRHPDDVKLCEEHVQGFNDADTADHYAHLLQDQELLKDETASVKLDEKEAKQLCAKLKTSTIEVQQLCLQDVITLPNAHVAEHYIELLQSAHDTTTKVEQRDAEKLCNHLTAPLQRTQCTQQITSRTAKEAAIHYSKLLQAELEAATKNGPRLTEKEAHSICAALENPLSATLDEECKRDLMTLNNFEVAQKYAQLLADTAAETQ